MNNADDLLNFKQTAVNMNKDLVTFVYIYSN